MAYVPVPKDLSRIKTKVAFNLTKRQLIFFAAALLTGLPLFFLLKGSTGTHPTNGRKQIMNGSSAVTQSIRCAIMSMKTPAMTDRRKNPCRIHGA